MNNTYDSNSNKMKTKTVHDMQLSTTDIAILGSSVMTGITGIIHTYGAFLFTAASTVVLLMIKWQQHRQTMTNLKLDEELKRRKLEQ